MKPVWRRSRAALVALLAAWGATAGASEEDDVHGQSGLSVYTNDDGVRVISPWAEARVKVGGPLEVGAGWKADVITAASVDILTSATSGFSETRNEARVNVAADLREVRLRGAAIGSLEPDTHAYTISASGELDLFSRTLTLGLGYGLGLDSLGSVHEPSSLWRDRTTHQLDASVTQVLGKSTLISVTLTAQQNLGFLSSPYRLVPLFPRDESQWTRRFAQWIPERHPESRERMALAVALRQAIGPSVFLRGKYRGYFDSWAMAAHSGEVGAALDVGDGIVLEVSERIHWQSRVSFYRPVYTVSRDYVTRDRKLAEMLSSISSLGARLRFGRFEALIRGELHATGYEDVLALGEDALTPLDDTLGFVGQIGLGLEL